MKVLNVINKIYYIVILILLAIIIVCAIGIKTSDLQFFIVLSGSMQPTFNVNDVVIVKTENINSVKEDDIITFKENNSYVTHRAVHIDNIDRVRITTKGDNNNVSDKNKVTSDNFVGICKYIVPNGGYILSFIQSPMGIITLCCIPIILISIGSTLSYLCKNYSKDSK